MRLVPRPSRRPFHCAILPQVGQTHPSAQWICTGSTLGGGWDDVYLSDLGVAEAARLFGFPSRGELTTVTAERDAASERVSELEAENTELDAENAQLRERLDAVHVLRQGGFTTSRKPGPKTKAAV